MDSFSLIVFPAARARPDDIRKLHERLMRDLATTASTPAQHVKACMGALVYLLRGEIAALERCVMACCSDEEWLLLQVGPTFSAQGLGASIAFLQRHRARPAQ